MGRLAEMMNQRNQENNGRNTTKWDSLKASNFDEEDYTLTDADAEFNPPSYRSAAEKASASKEKPKIATLTEEERKWILERDSNHLSEDRLDEVARQLYLVDSIVKKRQLREQAKDKDDFLTKIGSELTEEEQSILEMTSERPEDCPPELVAAMRIQAMRKQEQAKKQRFEQQLDQATRNYADSYSQNAARDRANLRSEINAATGIEHASEQTEEQTEAKNKKIGGFLSRFRKNNACAKI
jgi:hypothetical protein